MNRAELKARARASLGGGIFQTNWLMGLLVCLVASLLVGAVSAIPYVGSIISLILAGPIAYGTAFVFLKLSRDREPIAFEHLFRGFSDDFGGLFILNLMISIFTFLWSLLFVIPGIIKGLSYSMAYYVKLDHPELDWRGCIKTSQQLMQGHKGEYFVLQLSFIGWWFVGALCFGIGTLWVIPYMNAADAEFYNELVRGQSTVAE